ncbi:MAG: hypothetical protein SGARI_005717 [Bacillariaceae sp.]
MTSASTPPHVGTRYASDDDNDDSSVSSGSSSDADSDDEEHDGVAPAVAEEEDEEVIKIRQKAFDLINKAGGPSKEERKQWPQNPKKLHYPVPQIQQQQQQAASQSSGERSFAGPYADQYNSPYQQSAAGTQHHTAAAAAHEAEKLSVTSLFINCVSDLCKQSGKEIIQSGASILSSGYQRILRSH